MARKICFILFLYYAAGTCAVQGTRATAGEAARRAAPPAVRRARVVVCTAAVESWRAAEKKTVTPPRYTVNQPESRAEQHNRHNCSYTRSVRTWKKPRTRS